MTAKRILLTGVALAIMALLTMGLFGFFKKSPGQRLAANLSSDNPYKDSAINLIYNLFFCDDLDLYKTHTQKPYSYPFDILFSDKTTMNDLQKIIGDTTMDPRTRVLAYNKQLAMGHKPGKKELLAVIVEVGLKEGLDVLASFQDGTARYINYTGKLLVWETTTDTNANELKNDLFSKSTQIINQVGPWDKPRKPHPTTGNARITFLVSDGLYFGEGPTDVLFEDQLGGPALLAATQLMQYLTETSLKKSPEH